MNWALKGEKFSDMLVNGRRIGERAALCSPEISLSSQGHQNFPKDPNDPEGDVIPVVPLPGLPGVERQGVHSSLSLPEDKADPGHSEISATKCPKASGRVLVHTSVSPSPDNLRRFALEREASEQVEIYLWKLVKGEHWPIPTLACPPSCAPAAPSQGC